MAPIVEAEARLTSQNQITVPAVIRKALRLKGGKSRIKFQILPGEGRVVVARADSPKREEEDPALKPFLALLAKDIEEHPERLKPFPRKLYDRAKALTERVEVDLDGPLTGED